MKNTKLMLGDNIQSLKKLPDNSIDSIVTDPPYALTSIKKRFGKEGSSPAQYEKKGGSMEANIGKTMALGGASLKGEHKEIQKTKNNHPTLKPIKLMTYLCRLITPENGIVLDPFMGSGSTGIAALLEGFRFVGMELDSDYFKIAEARIESYEKYREFIK